MVNLFEIMRTAQSGQAMNNLSRQFGLAPPDTQRAVEALLPAFSLAFQRSVHDPNAFAQLIELMGSGRYAPFYDGSPREPARTMAGWADGAELINRIMGSKDVSRKVAEQAAVATGIGADILQQMLPLVAATLMGGVFRSASLQGLGDLLARWADAFHRAHAAQQPAPRPQPNPFEIWTSLLAPFSAGMPGGGAPTAQVSQRGPGQATLADPVEAWSAMVDAMLGREPPAPPAAAPEPPKPANPLQALAQMFEAGTTMQAQYVAALQGIMDRFWQPGQRHGA